MLWVSGALSTLERLSIVSYLQNGHAVRLFSYEPIPNLPQGTIREDARAILPESAVFANPAAEGHGGVTVFANFFRYQLLLQRGGIWSDCDVVCLKPLDFAAEMEYFFATERMFGQHDAASGIRVASCVFKVPAGSPVIERTLQLAQSANLATAPWGTTGPYALNQAVSEVDLNRFLLNPEVICPVDWWQLPTLLSGLTMLQTNTYAVHFWNEIWRRNFLDKNADYDPHSLFERLKAHYLGPRGKAHA